MCLNRRLVSTPIPPDRPMNPFQLENLAVRFPFRRPRRDELSKRLLKREPRIVDPMIQRVDRLARERDRLEPRRKRHIPILVVRRRRVDHVLEQRRDERRHVHPVQLEQDERRTALHHLPQFRSREIDGGERKVVERAPGTGEQREETVVAPARGHAARVPDARQQLEIAQQRRREGVHEMRDAVLVVADRDEDEGGEARHVDAVARAVPLGLALVLRDLDVEVGEVRGAGEDTEKLFDVGRSVAAAKGQLGQLSPWQRLVAIRHRPGRYL